jgi:thioredoxin reductase
MNGVEFLEQALDVYPGARRVLLTAYADTNAAIDAINVVDLDHYLLKPWDPPEEKLYPVLDDLLEAWRRSDHRPVASTKVVGHRWSARSSEVREFLARNQVPYRWYSSDDAEGQRLLAAAGQDGQRLPLVITPDGTPLVAPEAPELAARVGLATTPTAEFYDLVVIGGGPAGLGAAVYGASEGLRTVLIEMRATGGQAAVYFAAYARSVSLLVRAPSLEASMSSYLIEQIAGIPNVSVRTCTVVAEAHGDEHLERLTLRDAGTGERETVVTNHLFVFIGAAPRTDWLDGVVVRDQRGFVCTGPSLLADGERPPDWPLDRDPFFLESSVPGVFVAGDVRAESVKRVASAVGEGAMAVMLVHRYLGER